MKVKVVLLSLILITIASSCVSSSISTRTQIVSSTSDIDATAKPEPVTIKFWEWFGGAWGDFFEEEANLFNEKYPWITVEVSHYPDPPFCQRHG